MNLFCCPPSRGFPFQFGGWNPFGGSQLEGAGNFKWLGLANWAGFEKQKLRSCPGGGSSFPGQGWAESFGEAPSSPMGSRRSVRSQRKSSSCGELGRPAHRLFTRGCIGDGKVKSIIFQATIAAIKRPSCWGTGQTSKLCWTRRACCIGTCVRKATSCY